MLFGREQFTVKTEMGGEVIDTSSTPRSSSPPRSRSSRNSPRTRKSSASPTPLTSALTRRHPGLSATRT